MVENSVLTPGKARLKKVKSGKGKNWVFLPGGPGVDASYFLPLTNKLSVEGSLWHFELPPSGVGMLNEGEDQVKQWPLILENLFDILDELVLVGHSFGGMLILEAANLEKYLDQISGIVLLNSSPTRAWENFAVKAVEALKTREMPHSRRLLTGASS